MAAHNPAILPQKTAGGVLGKILLVDDDAVLRDTVGTALRKRGYELRTAQSGDEGVAMAREYLPDLIICDVQMDCGDGYSALAALRETERTAAIPFIFITGAADPTGMRRGMEGGADDYLAKPFAMEELFATVSARLKKHRFLMEQAEKRLADLRAEITLMLPHELRTPLAGILGLGEVLVGCRGEIEPADLVTLGQTILEAGRRLQRLFENFLLYAQTELLNGDAACALPPRSSVRLAGVLTDVATAVAEIHARSSDLKLSLQEGTAAMSREMLGKVIREVLDNAFKFSAQGQPVHLLCELVQDKVVIEARDAGVGMTNEQVAEIGAFRQFFRRVYQHPGSGLGLAIAKNLVELHGGTLQVRSQTGKGTTVRLILRQSRL